MKKHLIVPVLGSLLVSGLMSGCSFVKPVPQAADILLLKPYQARECEQVSRTTTQVMDKVWFVNRNPERMAEELATLAKNTAVEKGGNAVAPDSEIENGKQRFIIYNCQHMR